MRVKGVHVMKKQKGMTLFEIVISLGIYALLAMLLAEIMSVVNNTMTATSQLNERLAFQSKFADNKLTRGANLNTTGNLIIHYGDNGTEVGHFSRADDEDDTTTFEFNEYAGIYTNRTSRNEIDYVEEVNYRFMTFDFHGEDAAEWPGPAFGMHVMLLPYSRADGLTVEEEGAAVRAAENLIKTARKIKIEANGHLVDNSGTEPELIHEDIVLDIPDEATAKSYVRPGDDGMTRWIDFFIENQANHPTGNQVKNDYEIHVTFLDASGNQLVEVNPTDVFMYVKRGSTESYYRQCAVSLDLKKALVEATAGDAMRVCKSKKSDEAYTANEINPPLLTSDDPEETEETPE